MVSGASAALPTEVEQTGPTAQMSVEDIQQLVKLSNDLEALPAEEQERLKRLHEELIASKSALRSGSDDGSLHSLADYFDARAAQAVGRRPRGGSNQNSPCVDQQQKKQLSVDLLPLLKWHEAEMSRQPGSFPRPPSRMGGGGYSRWFAIMREIEGQLRKTPALSDEDKQLLGSIRANLRCCSLDSHSVARSMTFQRVSSRGLRSRCSDTCTTGSFGRDSRSRPCRT